jgi:hypothetical protein
VVKEERKKKKEESVAMGRRPFKPAQRPGGEWVISALGAMQ